MGPHHEAQIDVHCPSCGATSTTSVYTAQRSQKLRCPNCGATIDLSSEACQRELDRVEQEWLDAWEQEHGHAVGES
jgi:transcription elongation factor Elf1